MIGKFSSRTLATCRLLTRRSRYLTRHYNLKTPVQNISTHNVLPVSSDESPAYTPREAKAKPISYARRVAELAFGSAMIVTQLVIGFLILMVAM